MAKDTKEGRRVEKARPSGQSHERAKGRVARGRVKETPLDRERRLRRYNEVLVELSKSSALGEGDLERALAEITEAAVQNLDVQRASLWMYAPDRASIICADLYEANERSHERGTELFAKDFPVYFKALEHERTIPAHDAHRDPRTSEFSGASSTPRQTSTSPTPSRVPSACMASSRISWRLRARVEANKAWARWTPRAWPRQCGPTCAV